MSAPNEPGPHPKRPQVALRSAAGAVLGVAGLLSLRVSAPPSARGLLLFIGYCGVYYGGFIALAAAVLVLLPVFRMWSPRHH